jgi:pimeloyl-ACP methyl ester carboxylesterase
MNPGAAMVRLNLRFTRVSAALLVAWLFLVPSAAIDAAQEQAAASGSYADVPGARIWYTDTGGKGIPIVLLHAATGSTRAWEHQTGVFTKAGFRVIAYDRRGFGRTVVTPGAPPGTSADDLQAVLDRLHLDRIHLVSTAAGGFVAFDYALSFPRRLRTLVVANSIGGVQDEDFLQAGRRVRPPSFTAMPAELRELGPSYRFANPEGTERWVALEHANRAEGPAPPAQTMRNRITFAALERIEAPTLLLTGDADMFEPPAVLRLFAARIKQAKAIVVPEAGHSTYWEQPEAFNRAVLDFIRRH